MKNKNLLTLAAVALLSSFIWSLLSLFKLGGIGDGDAIYTPLRIINRNVILLSLGFLFIIIYLWRKDKVTNS